MTNLDPCPFCGDTPSTGLCGERVIHDCKTLKAFISCTVEDWNTRYKRTCNMVAPNRETIPYPRCSACGAPMLNAPNSFCAQCGAEVVDGD